MQIERSQIPTENESGTWNGQDLDLTGHGLVFPAGFELNRDEGSRNKIERSGVLR